MRKFAGVFIVCFCAAMAMAADLAGTWRLNLQKSKFRSANTTAETLMIEKTGPDSYRYTFDMTLTSGEKRSWTLDRVYDGKERAVNSSDAGESRDSEICEFVTGGGRKIAMKTDGKVVRTITSTLSGDGQTLTNLRSDVKGEDVLVFDREKEPIPAE